MCSKRVHGNTLLLLPPWPALGALHMNLPSKLVSPSQVRPTAQKQIKTFNIPKRRPSVRVRALKQGHQPKEKLRTQNQTISICSRQESGRQWVPMPSSQGLEGKDSPSRSSSMKTGAAKAVRCVDVKPSREHVLIAE